MSYMLYSHKAYIRIEYVYIGQFSEPYFTAST